jgi:prepilin-type processing-associated H-X9-DG protein
MEQNQIAEKYDWSTFFWSDPNASLLTNLAISTYTCPSDWNNHKTEYWLKVCEHNYVACMGRDGVLDVAWTRSNNSQNCLIDGTSYDHQSPYNAMFTAACYAPGELGINSSYPLTTTFADIIDGTSNTVALSETVQGVGDDWRGIIWYGIFCFFNTNQSPNTMMPDILRDGTLHTRHPMMDRNTTGGDPDGGYLRLSARSWHVGGVNAALADGSVRFVRDQINLNIWRAVGSTNGNEIESLH